MATKETPVNTTEAELKAVAKAMGASLKRAGHGVPHSALLHALAAALDKRDWHILKAGLATATTGAEQSVEVAGPEATHPVYAWLKGYGDSTRFFVRLAHALGTPVELSQDGPQTLERARAACGESLSGVLSWGGWNVPANLATVQCTVDAGDFRPEKTPARGAFEASLPGVRGTLRVEVACNGEAGWYLTAEGAQQAYEQLERLVPDSVFAQRKLPATMGPEVRAKFWTDDHVFEVYFDARPFLAQASDEALEAIVNVGYVGSECTDEVALYAERMQLDADLVEAFGYLGAVQKSRLKNPPGFECQVDGPQLLDWLAQCRPVLLHRLLCERHEVSTVQAEEEEIRGMWDWLDDQGNACEHSFDTEEEARANAVEMLGLLAQEKESAAYLAG